MTSFDWENILPTEYWIEPYKETNNQRTRNYILYGKNSLTLFLLPYWNSESDISFTSTVEFKP
jgi:hypothetical protein